MSKTKSTQSSFISRIATSRARLIVLAVAALILLPVAAFTEQPTLQKHDMAAFFNSILGDWIGFCEQSTNGEEADNKYFHANVSQTSPEQFETKFNYYRVDQENGKPLHIGESKVVTTIMPDGTAKNEITGKGQVLVDNKPKDQEHELTEVLTCGENGLTGEGSGQISVKGLTLGAGNNGKIRACDSVWAMQNDTLTITQKLNAKFKILFFSKSFDIEAKYTATRGTDVAGLMSRMAKLPAAPASQGAGK